MYILLVGSRYKQKSTNTPTDRISLRFPTHYWIWINFETNWKMCVVIFFTTMSLTISTVMRGISSCFVLFFIKHFSRWLLLAGTENSNPNSTSFFYLWFPVWIYETLTFKCNVRIAREKKRKYFSILLPLRLLILSCI